MKVGDKIYFTKNTVGTIIKTEGSYGLIKFNHGQFVFNLSKIDLKKIVKNA
jgi:hypothetical protein